MGCKMDIYCNPKDLAKFAEMRSAEEFLLRAESEPEFLHRTLTTMFGEASKGIYQLIEEKVEEMES